MTDDKDWERLGRKLVERRTELGFPKRLPWVTGILGLKNDRIQSDLEKARRTNYDAATLALVEQQYQWEPGSIDDVLAGGEPRRKAPRIDVVFDNAGPSLLQLTEDQLVKRVQDLTEEVLSLGEAMMDLANRRDRTAERLEQAQDALAELQRRGPNLFTGLAEAARTTGQPSAGQRRRADAEQAGEPPADDPDDLEPR